MKVLKSIAIVIGGIILVALIISLFLPSVVRVERSIVINAPDSVVFKKFNNLKEFRTWSPWSKMDPDMKVIDFGPEEGKGCGYSWESKEVGNGKMTIMASAAVDSIETELDFMENGKGLGKWYFKQEGQGVKVSWVMISDMGNNPVSKLFGLFMDKMLGKDFENGLAAVKSACEK